jgi:hypothetical protein
VIASISWLWTNSSSYNFASSEYGGIAFHALEGLIFLLVVRELLKPLKNKLHRHLECDVAGCENWGRVIAPTSFRACHEHHPHLKPEGHTVAELEDAAKNGHQ